MGTESREESGGVMAIEHLREENERQRLTFWPANQSLDLAFVRNPEWL